jgi:2-polyprenyl-3-methyl-5-hydroxy-6-metoxy-1,4-benzoquinol methylase
MTGLALSDYIWIQHIKTIRYYEKFLTEQEHKDSYLEIGPGYGQFLIRSIRSGKWNEYLAVDVSPTSVEMCKKFLKCAGISANVETRDFLAFEADRRFDCIVCGEVLEHVEQPGQMMKKCAIC